MVGDMITRGQKHLAEAVPNDTVNTARSVRCTRDRQFEQHDRLTDTANISNNSQRLMHVMQPSNDKCETLTM